MGNRLVLRGRPGRATIMIGAGNRAARGEV
jgi:hypothetical protein